MSIRYFPPLAAMTGFGKMITGRVHFKRDSTATRLFRTDGERHRTFRAMQVDPSDRMSGENLVRLTIRFRFARFSQRTNRALSLLPVPVIAGMPGILEKVWTYCDETSYSQGIYLFESKVLAEAYIRSPVVKVLRHRTIEGSYSWEIKDVDRNALTPGAIDRKKEDTNGTDP